TPDCFSYNEKNADIWRNYFCEDFDEIYNLLEINSECRFLLKELSEIVEQIENGNFEPTPNNVNCDSCDYYPVCRKSLEDF
ncbi:PD-(D/E)XK nuclease family protein, partial [bacterium]|nr:PD-(D/E)XK nuclease family protein [bacterium]